MDTIDEFKNTIEKVEYILSKFPDTRNSTEQCIKKFQEYWPAIKSETIARCKRKIQNDPNNPRFLPEPEVSLRQEEKQQELRKFISQL